MTQQTTTTTVQAPGPPARRTAQPSHGAVTVPARAFRRLLLDTLTAADGELPPVRGVYLHSTQTADTTALTGIATDRFLAIQADIPAHGQFPGTFLNTPDIHRLITALTTRLPDTGPADPVDAPDTDVRLVRDHHNVALHWAQDTAPAVTVPVSAREFPLAVLQRVVGQPPAEPTPAASTFSEDYLNVIVQIALQRDVPVRLTAPGGNALAHFTIGDHCRAWLMPAHTTPEGT